MKKKFLGLGFVIALLVAMVAGAMSVGIGYSALPSSKAAVAVEPVTVLSLNSKSPDSTPWTTIFESDIRCAEQKDLLVDAALECGLYTDTLVRSKDAVKDTSNANASIKVRVLVDGNEPSPALPGEVCFAARSQTLSATLQGILSGTDLNGDGIISLDECTTSPEEIQLILDTMGAHAFNFIMPDVTAGVHHVEVQAKIDTDASYQKGSAEAKATIGKGSITIDEVRLVKDSISL
ncbi:MAG TPA: hypothetical protein VE439_02140 [Anaerolineae bacterium]|nr:hypothetical protein [Anaerolineae bacterium]